MAEDGHRRVHSLLLALGCEKAPAPLRHYEDMGNLKQWVKQDHSGSFHPFFIHFHLSVQDSPIAGGHTCHQHVTLFTTQLKPTNIEYPFEKRVFMIDGPQRFGIILNPALMFHLLPQPIEAPLHVYKSSTCIHVYTKCNPTISKPSFKKTHT